MSGHVSVLLSEVLELLRPQEGGHFLDATFGGGGHTRALLEASAQTYVTALDCDPQAVERARALKEAFGERFTFYDMNFAQLRTLPVHGFTGALFDLGVSSFQLDQAERGFSFRAQGATDMRLNPREGLSGEQFLMNASEAELIRAVRDYGEEPRWRKVVQAIEAARSRTLEDGTPLLGSTQALAEVIRAVAGAGPLGRSRIDPATRTFQGIRIAVNDELGALESALPAAFERLAAGGVLAVISFHSLEDRPVKRYFKTLAGRPEDRFDHRAQDERTRLAELITRKPIIPGEQEQQANRRSRSAKLRAVRKLDPATAEAAQGRGRR